MLTAGPVPVAHPPASQNPNNDLDDEHRSIYGSEAMQNYQAYFSRHGW